MDRAGRARLQWQAERPDIDSDSMKLFGRIAQLNQLTFQHVLTPFFSEHGLQSGEFDVLATLRRSGAPYSLTPTEMYEDALISSGSMTNRINRLTNAGLVKRSENPQDKRGVFVTLTNKGFNLIDGLMVQHVENLKKVLSPLDEQEKEQLGNILLSLIKGFD
ncbi:MarR family transcriptional regulator [Psychromonas sp. SP041]|uniref:MarR family winged helix-turn-helix transcriptional regulator n=1 Tax=Psychromonas sp. SP041 TaxID=1365007 RepID=UPI0010C7DD2A|nr:MarR family transcriptional regulator [Psychromonas sp. SP041]